MNRKEHTHIGIYGLVIKDNKILLIKKANGPYKGKLDLPGGSLEFGEKPENTLIREMKEETNLEVKEFKINNSDSVTVEWNYDKADVITHHIGVFYDITKYEGDLKNKIELNDANEDSLGASFYEIGKLIREDLSLIAVLELEKLGYKINN